MTSPADIKEALVAEVISHFGVSGSSVPGFPDYEIAYISESSTSVSIGVSDPDGNEIATYTIKLTEHQPLP